jgi:large subunit ribosomal protein L17
MLRNLASSLILTERDAEFDDNAPKVKGRVVTTLHKAKEVRPLVERCITIARHSLKYEREAREFAVDAERNTEQWKRWRGSDEWQKWSAAIAPAVAARRRALRLLGDKQAVQILFDELAPRFEDRDGGYTRVIRLAKPRLGDAGTRAIVEFVGVHDRVVEHSRRPTFEEDAADEPSTEEAPDAADRGKSPDEVAGEGESPPAAESTGNGTAAASDKEQK